MVGQANGTNGVGTNGVKGGTFLFTSESVGEGHPDKIAYASQSMSLLYSD